MKIHASARARRGGSTLVETGVVLTAFFLVVFGIIEFGRMVMVKNVMDNAAREGARYGTTHTSPVTITVGGQTTTAGASDADVKAAVEQRLSGVKGQLKNVNIEVFAADRFGAPLQNASGTVGWNDAAFGEFIGVRVTADYCPILPSFLSLKTTFNMTSLSVMYSEAN